MKHQAKQCGRKVAELAACMAVALTSTLAAAGTEARYEIQPFGPAGDDMEVRPAGMSQGGRVTGAWCCNGDGEPEPFTYQKGKYKKHPLQSAEAAGGLAINNLGVWVGWQSRPGEWQTHFYEDATGRHLLGNGLFEASDINDAGQIVGIRRGDNGLREAAVYSIADGSFTTFPGDDGRINPHRINSAGAVTGNIGDYTAARCFVYESGTMTDMGTMGGDFCSASDINDKGHVVGTSRNAQNKPRAFLWKNGAMVDLLPHREKSSATAINDKGQIVGRWKEPSDYFWTEFLYEKGKATALKDLLSPEDAQRLTHIYTIAGITNSGEIIASGWLDGQYRSLKLKPITTK